MLKISKQLFSLTMGTLGILLASISSIVNAQTITNQVIANGGSQMIAGGNTLSYTIGQPIISTNYSSRLTSGFWEPSFNAKPVVKNLSPINGAIDQPFDVKLSWVSSDPENDLLTHAVYFRKYGEKATLLNCGDASLSSCNSLTLEYGMTYFWHVETTDSYGNTTKGSEWTFKTVPNQESVVKNLSPCSVTDQELEPALSWNATDPESEAMTFNVFFGESLDNQILICEDIANMTCAVPNTLAYNTNYFWQVEAKDSYGNLVKSQPCGFQTKGNQPPHKASNPVLKDAGNVIDPSIDMVDPLLPLEFGWQGNSDPENDGVAYQVCYANLNEINLADITPETVIPCVSPSYIQESSATLPTGKLEYDASYAWIVSVKDVHDNKSEWDIWEFKTKPAPVNLLLDASSGYSSTLVKWTINNDANVHHYRILRAKEGEEFTPDKDMSYRFYPPDDSFEDEQALPTDIKHCYRIDALDNQGKPLYQSTVSCVTYGITTLAMKSSGGLKGQKVDVPISLLNGGKLQIGSGDIWLRYDPKVIKVTGIKKGILIDGAGMDYSVSHRVRPQPDGFAIVKISVVDNQLNSALTGEGALIDVVFDVIGDAGTNSPLKLLPFTPVNGGSSIQDHNFDDIPLAFEDNTFTVNVRRAARDGKNGPLFHVGEAYVKGDLNGNGAVQTVDARKARFIGIKKITATAKQRTAGDVNNDRLINSADACLIIDYALNGEWPRVGLGNDSRQAQQLRRRLPRDGKETPILISLSDVSGVAGSEVTITLYMNDVVSLSALNLAIVYDTQVIERIVNVTKTDLAEDTSLVYHDDGNGILRIGADTQTPINGSGAVATITVKLATGGNVRSTPLLIGQAHLYDRAGRNFTTFDLHKIEADHGKAIIEDVPPLVEPPVIEMSLEELTQPKPEPGAIYTGSGKILDQDGNPMIDATVKVGDKTITTDDNGNWAVVGLEEGDYPVTVTQDGYSFSVEQCVVANQQNCRPNIKGSKNAKPALCNLYIVNDIGLNNSQIIAANKDEVRKLGPLYKGYDIEAIAVHPETDKIYGASGNDTAVYIPNGFLYKIDGETGELIKIGATGFEEIGDLAFDANGILWAWAKGDGLITIDITNGLGTLVVPSDLLVEGLTLSKGTDPLIFYVSVNNKLWKYNTDTSAFDESCALSGEVEALEMIDNILLMGIDKDKTLMLHGFDVSTCEIVIDENVDIQYDGVKEVDIEGIAVPIKACQQ